MTVSSGFYIDDNAVIHRVPSIRCTTDKFVALTRCGEEFDYHDKSERMDVPVRMIDTDSICVECERDYRHSNHLKFHRDSEESDYIFFVTFSLDLGNETLTKFSRILNADSVDDVKEKVDNEFSKAELNKYHYIARVQGRGEWDVLHDEESYDG